MIVFFLKESLCHVRQRRLFYFGLISCWSNQTNDFKVCGEYAIYIQWGDFTSFQGVGEVKLLTKYILKAIPTLNSILYYLI